jgi:hypothetical protein
MCIINWELWHKTRESKPISTQYQYKSQMNNPKRKDMGLLNYEGDVLKLFKTDNAELVIYDQWNCIAEVLDFEGFANFLDGRIDIVDSEGKSWNWLREHPDARTRLYKIFEYLNS